jgi:putative aldouronate transport system substrate-binding protein
MKKTLAMLLALVMVVGMLSACGSAPAEETKTEAPATENKKDEPAKEEAAASEYPEYLNLDGYRPIVKEGEEITLKVAVVKHPSCENPMDEMWMTKFIEEKLNINLEFEEIENAAAAEKKSLLMASGDIPDLMFVFGFSKDEIVKYGIEEEMLMPISDYMSEELTPNIIAHFASDPTAEAGYTATDGKIYGIPQLSANIHGFGGTIPHGYRYFVDTTWMEAAGYDAVPEDIDGFVDMLRDMKKAGDKMGVNEVWPQLAQNWRCVYKEGFGWMNNSESDDAIPVWDVEEGKMVVPVAQEKYQEYIKLLNTLYTEGLVHPDVFTMDGAAGKALMTERKGGVWRTDAPYTVLPEKENGWNDFIGLAPLKSEHNPEGYAKASFSYATNPYINISADTEYPEVCLRLVDYLLSPEGYVYNAIGAPAGSEDCMGLIEGYTILDDGYTIDFGAQDDDYTSAIGYKVNNINLSWQYLAGEQLFREYACELAGANYAGENLDYENDGDDHYRHILANACEGRLLTGVPDAFMTPDDAARFSDLKTVLNDYTKAETAKFIVGQRSLDELPKFQEELKGIGLDEYIELIDKYYANVAAPTVVE